MQPVRVQGRPIVQLLATPNPVHASQTPKCIKGGLSINPPMKCRHCKKKLSALVFTCACEKTFCVNCRLPEEHACPAQVKASVVLPPAVIAPKVEKI
jgi:hypothetical protein